MTLVQLWQKDFRPLGSDGLAHGCWVFIDLLSGRSQLLAPVVARDIRARLCFGRKLQTATAGEPPWFAVNRLFG